MLSGLFYRCYVKRNIHKKCSQYSRFIAARVPVYYMRNLPVFVVYLFTAIDLLSDPCSTLIDVPPKIEGFSCRKHPLRSRFLHPVRNVTFLISPLLKLPLNMPLASLLRYSSTRLRSFPSNPVQQSHRAK